MKRNFSVILALILLSTPAILLAQRGKGGGAGAGAQQRQGQNTAGSMGQGSQAGDQDRTRDRTQDQTRDQARLTQRDRLHAQATTQQRDQYRTCDESMQQTRSQARMLARTARSNSANMGQIAGMHKQMTEQLRTLEQNRVRMYEGLNEEQQSAIQDRNRQMLQTHERIQNQLQQMERELAGPETHSADLAKQARATEREMNTYQKHLRETAKTLNLLSD